MPSRISAEKSRARAMAATHCGLRDFLQLVNEGTSTEYPAFDAGRYPKHQDLVTALRQIADEFHVAAITATAPDCGPRVTRRKLKLSTDAIFEAATNDVDHAWRDIAVWMNYVVQMNFLGLAAWRVLSRCATCGRYFIGRDDRQQYCQLTCRSSLQPANVTTRVRRHRVRRSDRSN